MKSKPIRIGSRGSDLALWQAHYFQDRLKEIGVPSEIKIITTKGDRIQHLSFDKIEGKGFFTKEIEAALLQNEVDVAIHSHKDLETQAPEGLMIAGVSYREDPSELLLIHPSAVDLSQPFGFKQGAIVGTSSARRKGQITAFRPDISIKDIRGNVPTRVNKLRSGDFDAILLAFAGVHRLGLNLSDLHATKLDPCLFIPAPAQGVLAFQCREGDSETASIIGQLHDDSVAKTIQIERSILSKFGGGCHIPIGVYAKHKNGTYQVRVSYADAWQTFNNRVCFEAQSLEKAIEYFDDLKARGYPKKVFISRNLQSSDYFARASKSAKVSLEAYSLIDIEPESFEASPIDFEWVFFASSNAVENFFKAQDINAWKNHRFGVAGSGTATTLGRYVDHIDFIGEGSDMHNVSKSFAAEVGSASVLFPISKQSLKSIQSALPSEQVHNVVCYQTKKKHVKIEPQDAYVFTSPSNVKSFMEAGNEITDGATVVAIGRSTLDCLDCYTIDARLASIPDEAELFALLAQ